MLDTTWLPVLIEVTAIFVGLAIYILHWSVRGHLRRIRCAKMLLAELNMMPVVTSTEILPHSAYNGLVRTASISHLDQSLQEQIHLFYRLVAAHNHDIETKRYMLDSLYRAKPIKPELDELTKTVKEFLRKNESGKQWVLKLFRAYDGDD